ncbi:electron transport complex subunit RsxA [ANME-1 cluster archaeon GoMg4]|nr:electron transport complex subunit RsxA [ANME-1 cluster archaeon GoMg4]
MENLLVIAVGAIFVNNFVLSRFLGLCPFFGVSRKTSGALGMGLAVIIVMTCASAITWPIYTYLLRPFNIEFMEIVTFILVIATFVQLIEMVIRKYQPDLYGVLGIYLPLITTNCAIMGVALLNVEENYSFIGSVVNGFAAGIGFTLALLLMSGIRERLEFADVPKSFQDLPIAFVSAALLALAFMAFSGMRL